MIWADAAYAGRFVSWARASGGWLLRVVRRRPDSHTFEVLPRRWVVERTLAWLGRRRRLSKDYESAGIQRGLDSRSHDPSNAQKTQAGLIPFSHTL